MCRLSGQHPLCSSQRTVIQTLTALQIGKRSSNFGLLSTGQVALQQLITNLQASLIIIKLVIGRHQAQPSQGRGGGQCRHRLEVSYCLLAIALQEMHRTESRSGFGAAAVLLVSSLELPASTGQLTLS